MKNDKLKRKIDSLLISIQALDIYSQEYNMKYNNETIISNIKFGNYNRHPKYNKKCNFEDSIKTIYKINNYMTNLYIQTTIQTILNNYSNNIFCHFTQQYLQRYKYIYIRNQNYYNNLSYCINTKNRNTAIANLYILNKINTNHGTYKLIKYLHL